MMRKEKRFYLVLIWGAFVLTILIALSCILPVIFNMARAKRPLPSSAKGLADGVFRLHIIANSDSDEDQRIKLAVRDAVLRYEKEFTGAAGAGDSHEAENILMEKGGGLLNAAREALKRENAPYDAQLIIGEFDFPEKKYGDKTYPAGNYRALRILLGNAEGRNWWCVMFPPLCIIDAKDDAIESGNTVRFESIFVKIWHYLFGGGAEKQYPMNGGERTGGMTGWGIE